MEIFTISNNEVFNFFFSLGFWPIFIATLVMPIQKIIQRG